MLLHYIYILATTSIATATNLFVASYAGNITTLSLTEQNGTYSLEPTHYNDGCSPNPSWLTLDISHDTVYCLDEGLETVNGSLSSFTINLDGSLSLVQKSDTISGPVSSVIYGNAAAGKRAIALAHYSGSALSDWTLDPNKTGAFTANQAIHFNLTAPGPVTDRQSASHAHEAFLDPTGQFILVPDLGADLVRVFSLSPSTLLLSAQQPLEVEAGAGPRHIAFWQPYDVICQNCTSYMFLVTELSNQVISYRVSYPSTGGMSFERVFQSGTYGPDMAIPVGNAAAEIAVSPDSRFLIISNRNDSSFSIPPPPSSSSSSSSSSYPSANKTIPSDSLSTFRLNTNGTLTFSQLWPAGGVFPRQFSINKAGDLVAVGLQTEGRVVVLSRDVGSGDLGKPVAEIGVEGNVTFVGWDE